MILEWKTDTQHVRHTEKVSLIIPQGSIEITLGLRSKKSVIIILPNFHLAVSEKSASL